MVSTATTRSVLRGKLTGFRLLTACILGALLGFVPGFVDLADPGGGFMQAPALILALLLAVLVLRCSLIVFLVTVVLAKLLALPAVGVSYAVGEFLLDGPTSGLFRAMINAPILAWCGFQYYATTGGLLLGLVLGILWFLILRRVLRRQVADSEESRPPGSPVRLVGLAAVALMLGGGWLLQSTIGGAAFKSAFRDGLERANGATVDIAGLDLDLGRGLVVIDGLAMADPNALGVDLFRAEKVRMALGTTALLRRRFVIEEITSVAAMTGRERATPGKRVHRDDLPPPPPPEEGEKTLDDYLKDAKEWERRLRQVGAWVESVFRSEPETDAERERRQEQEKKVLGPRNVAASHLITAAPALLVRKLSLLQIARAGEPDNPIDIVAANLSTNPRLVGEPAHIEIVSKKKTFGLELELAKQAGGVRSSFFHNAIPVDAFMAQLGGDAATMLAGGTIAVSLDGVLQFRPEGTWIEMPVKVALQNTTLSIQGASPTRLERLELPLGLRGPLAAPRIRFDASAFADALVAAGKAELANQLRKQAGKLLDGKLGDQKKAAEEAAKKAREELEKRLPGGVLGGKKKREPL